MYEFDKPTANMNIGHGQVIEMLREHNTNIYNDDQRKNKARQDNLISEQNEYIKYYSNYMAEQVKLSNNRAEFLSNTKNAFMSECLFKLFKDSSVTPLSESDMIVARNLVNKFVIENGAGNLVSSFATKNLLLSEFSRLTTKYYNIVVEKCEDITPGSVKDFSIGCDVTDEFLKELELVDTYDASKLIKQRVSDAISEFIDSNMEQKLEYEEIIKDAQDKIESANNESYVESYSNAAKRKINEMKMNREKNVFHCLVESLAKSILKDDELKARYMNEATIDMDKVVDSTQLIYTMIEMANTTNMIKIDESYLNSYIKSL